MEVGKNTKKCCSGKQKIKTPTDYYVFEDSIDRLSNQVADWIQHREYEKAMEGCKKLVNEFPYVIDGFTRSASLYEYMGNNNMAIEFYKKCITFIQNNPEGFDKNSVDYYEQNISRLQKGSLK